MSSEGLFRGTFPILERALDLRSMRHHLIVSNIANKDTPNFKAFDLMVEEEMAQSPHTGDAAHLRRTDGAHLSGRHTPGASGNSRSGEERELSLRGDGNSVDMDEEMAKLSENNLLYDALAQIISKKFRGLNDAIKCEG